MISKFNPIKNEFMVLLDGYGSRHPDDIAHIPPLVEGLDSYRLGICKLEVVDGEFHVYLRRPGLLIGAKGETLHKLENEMGRKIYVHEVVLTHDEEE